MILLIESYKNKEIEETITKEEIEDIRYKIYRYSRDQVFFFTLAGGCFIFSSVLELSYKKFDILVLLLFLLIFFFFWSSASLNIFFLERQALDKYPLHYPSRISFLIYPRRSFESGMTILISVCAIAIAFAGFFLSQQVSLGIEYGNAFTITAWPVFIIKTFLSHRLYKKKFFL